MQTRQVGRATDPVDCSVLLECFGQRRPGHRSAIPDSVAGVLTLGFGVRIEPQERPIGPKFVPRRT